MTQKDMNSALRSALAKYALDAKNPTGADLPKSLTAEKPPAMGTNLLKPSPSVRPPQPLAPPQPTGMASAQIGPAGKPAGNNAIFAQAPAPAPPANNNTALGGLMTSGGSAPQGLPPAQKPAGNPLMRQQVPDQIHPTKSHTGMGSYVDVLDRWYNPWTTQTGSERGEESLKGWGQTAMGVAGTAAATAAAIPATAAAGLTAAGGGAMTAGGTAATLGTEVVLPVAFEAGRQQFSGGTETPSPAQNAEQPKPDQQAAATPATQPTGQPQQPAAPQTPEQKQQANTDVMAKLNSNIPDAEKKQLAQQHVQQMLDSNPEMKQGMADLHAGKDTPQAKAFQAEVDKAGNAYIREEFAKLRQQNPGATPQQQGGMLQGIMQSYQNMPEPMKWMMGLGVGGGLLGILGSMFGGGGGMGLLGLLGLGAAGLAGAAGGMFGGGAQNFMADAVSGIGKSLGMVPEKLTDQQKQILLAKDPVAHITGGGKVPTRADAAKQVAAGRQQLGQIQMLNSMGGMTPRMLENMGLSPEEAQLAAKNVGTLSSAYSDQNSALNQHLQKGEEYSKPTWTSWGQELGSYMLGKRGCALARQWAKEAEDKDIKEWLQKFRARGQKGRWVNTRRSSRTEQRVPCHN